MTCSVTVLSQSECPVNFPVVSGGFALLLATGAAGGGLATNILPVVGAGLGLLGETQPSTFYISDCLYLLPSTSQIAFIQL